MEAYANIVPEALCTGCGSCSAICSRSCITMSCDERGFLKPYISREKCIDCGLCSSACPIRRCDDVLLFPKIEKTECYAAKNSSDEIINKSSSGGVFFALAKETIDSGGIVYGVTLSQLVEAHHIRVSEVKDLPSVMGAKYLQSNAWTVYGMVKKDLVAGRKVLFSGTPCQVAGLRSFLRKEYEKLTCCEIVCHGVPSYLAFSKYKESVEKQCGAKLKSIRFRDKTEGWKDNKLLLTFQDGSQICELGRYNSFMKGYIANLYVRESCADCRFKSFKSGADITIGDMWGIETIVPGYDERGGVSLLCVSSVKGKTLMKKVLKSLKDVVIVDYKKVKFHNPCIAQSVVLSPEKSQLFFNSVEYVSFEKLVEKLLAPTIFQRLFGAYSRIYASVRKICKVLLLK